MEAPEQVSRTGGTATSEQQQLQRLERELAQSRQALEDFTASVSHDLRAPLRHVSAFVRIAREDLGEDVDPERGRRIWTRPPMPQAIWAN